MADFRVIITRTADAAGALIEELTSGFAGFSGNLDIICAPVRVAAFEEASLASSPVHQLQDGGFDWLTFTSANGVLGFARLAGELGISVSKLAGAAKIACVGKSTAKDLAQRGLTPDFVPDIQDAAHMVSEWPSLSLVSGEATAPAERALCLQGANAKPTLADGLTKLGLLTETLTVYRMEKFPAPATLAPQPTTEPKVPELATADVLPLLSTTDAVIATAPSLLTELVKDYRHIGGEDFPTVVAIGNTTGETARQLNLKYVVAEHPQAKFLTKATKSLADLHFQDAK